MSSLCLQHFFIQNCLLHKIFPYMFVFESKTVERGGRYTKHPVLGDLRGHAWSEGPLYALLNKHVKRNSIFLVLCFFQDQLPSYYKMQNYVLFSNENFFSCVHYFILSQDVIFLSFFF